MSEVIRYLASYTPYEGIDLNGQCARHDGDYFVSTPDFDRVAAERDAALAELKAMGERYQKDLVLSRERWCYGNRADAKIAELQQRLTAADELNDTLRDIIAKAIGGDAYDCTRVWSAWGVGTMSDDDFVPVVDQEARLYEITDACLDEVTSLNKSQS